MGSTGRVHRQKALNIELRGVNQVGWKAVRAGWGKKDHESFQWGCPKWIGGSVPVRTRLHERSELGGKEERRYKVKESVILGLFPPVSCRWELGADEQFSP